MTCGTDIVAQRDADQRITYSLNGNYTFANLSPRLKVWQASGSVEDAFLTVTTSSTANGSVWTESDGNLILTLDKLDLDALPEGELLYDITLTDLLGFENPFVGGVFNLYDNGAESCGPCTSGASFYVGGQCVSVSIQGGALGVAASVLLADLNTAVAAAEASAEEAADSVASIPALIVGKLNTDGSNPAVGLLVNIGAVASADLADDTGAGLVGVIASGTGAVARTQQEKNRDVVSILDFGGVMNNAAASATNKTALINAVQSLRANPTVVQKEIDDPATITAYSTGVVEFPPGQFFCDPEILFEQDMGITLRGAGPRGYQNAVPGPSAIIFVGGCSTYGIKLDGYGARNFRAEGISLLYRDNTFTGDVFDHYSSPGTTFSNCSFGTAGLTAPTRYQTARSLIRSTYDEFLSCINCSFDGAELGWWSDHGRGTFGFGGRDTIFLNCNFYDFAVEAVLIPATRTRSTVKFIETIINPIQVSPERGMNISNVDGLSLDTCSFSGSTTHFATTEWLTVDNCTGQIVSCAAGEGPKAGTIYLNGSIIGGRWACDDGLTLTGGAVVAYGNEFSVTDAVGAAGFKIIASSPMEAVLGPDLFKAGVLASYRFTDAANLAAVVNYGASMDASTSKIIHDLSSRIIVKSVAEQRINVTAASYAVSAWDIGKTFIMSGGAAQDDVVLPSISTTPPGEFRFIKSSTQSLTIKSSGAGQLYSGVGVVGQNLAVTTAANQGQSVTLLCRPGIGWFVTSMVGAWTIT